MSCCQGNQNQSREYYIDPTNYDREDNTYVLQNQYYAPPIPGERTEFDMNMQKTFSAMNKPDFLNFNNKEDYVYIYNADGNVDQGPGPIMTPAPFTFKPFTTPVPFTVKPFTTPSPLKTLPPGGFLTPGGTIGPIPPGGLTPIPPIFRPVPVPTSVIPKPSLGPAIIDNIGSLPILSRSGKLNRKSLLTGQYYA